MDVLRATTTGTSYSDRLNRIPVMTRSHRRWLVVLAVLLLIDMADTNTFAFAAPAIRADWGLSVQQLGTLTSASFLGMFVGSVVGGRLADRFGRKPVILGAVGFFSLFSLLSASSVGVADLAAYRVLAGIGLQAMTVVVLTYVCEMFPPARRGRAQAWIVAVSLLGVPLMAWFARWVVPTGASSWRWIFIAGGAGLVLVAAAARWLPESVRWLQDNDRGERADALVRQLEQEAAAKSGGTLPAVVHQSVAVAARPLDLVTGGYLKRTFVLAVAMCLALSGFYGYNAWVPTLLTEHGFTTTQSLTYSSVMSLATVPGALLALLFIDRVERRLAVLALYTAVAGFMLVFGFTHSNTLLVASGLGITLLLQASVPCVYAYLPEIFPTSLRALGAGVCNGAGRLAVFGTTFLIAALLTWIGFTGVFLFLAAVVVLAGLVIAVFGERTRGRSLEDIAGSATGPAAQVGSRPGVSHVEPARV